MRKYPVDAFRGLYYAHRGLYDNEHGIPENSLYAFRRAAEKGYGAEMDVQVTKDGRVIVFHDDDLDRMCGVSGKIWDFTLAQLQQFRLLDTGETIPLFTDVLEVLKQGAGPLIIELKHGPRDRELCRKTKAILDRYPGVFCVESFDPQIVLWFRIHAPEYIRGQLAHPAENYARVAAPRTAKLLAGCSFSRLNRPDFIAYKIGPRPARVLRLRQEGVLLVGWTSHDAEKDAKENDSVIFEYCFPLPPLRYE